MTVLGTTLSNTLLFTRACTYARSTLVDGDLGWFSKVMKERGSTRSGNMMKEKDGCRNAPYGSVERQTGLKSRDVGSCALILMSIV